ncbi:MAG: hypothetical protein FWD59_06735 [Micrococcales bacterium]|nr:hypothetical protein [Micrococcales bacterium]
MPATIALDWTNIAAAIAAIPVLLQVGTYVEKRRAARKKDTGTDLTTARAYGEEQFTARQAADYRARIAEERASQLVRLLHDHGIEPPS